MFKRFPSAAIAAVLALTLAACATPDVDQKAATHPLPPDRLAAIDKTVETAWRESGAPGVVVGIWIPGEGSYIAAKGLADLATGQPLRVDDHTRIGSVTKTFTVTALLILTDEKKLGLDDPVSKYTPWVPNGRNITLRMLANMTSGLASYTESDAWVQEFLKNPNRVWTARELVDVGIAQKPTFPPNTGWHYSNTNTVLLGMIIEQVTGQNIGEVFAAKLFKPLGLAQTSWPTSGALPAPYAHGITTQTLDGTQADVTHIDPTWAFTAGALISTLDDLKRWVESYTTGSLISPEMQKQRLHWVTFPPMTPHKKYGLGIGSDNGWPGHTGELPGYNTCAYYLPEQKATIVVWVNSDIKANGASPATGIFKALTRVVTPGNVPN
jgi:D-alanyl-D-alanine carboxypeptidase